MEEKKKMNLYVIAGCNGAGKTTASFTVLPEMLNCREFVNADEIAAGLSPFNPEGVAIQAGRLMIDRIIHLLKEGATFAFETTLSTRSYVKLIQQAQKRGYFVTLLFFSLTTPEQAVKRVAKRASQGGHNTVATVPDSPTSSSSTSLWWITGHSTTTRPAPAPRLRADGRTSPRRYTTRTYTTISRTNMPEKRRRTAMNEREKIELARRIDKGILLAQTRLIEKAKRDNLTLVVRRNGRVMEVPAGEL